MFERRGYLLEVTHKVPTRRAFQELVDVLARYRYNEFYWFDASPDDKCEDAEIDLGKLGAYCQMQDIEFVRLDAESWERLFLSPDTICVATEAAGSLAGRVEEMRERMEKAEQQGRTLGRRRFLVTDLSDGLDWQPLAVSLPGIIFGGSLAVNGSKCTKMDLERELNVALEAPIAGLLLKLGTLYLRGGAVREKNSEFFNILASEIGYSRHPGLTELVLEDVSGVARGVRIAAERWIDRSDWAKEIVYMANLLDAACHRRDEKRLRELRDEHGRIWRLRHQPYGRVESMSRLPRF